MLSYQIFSSTILEVAIQIHANKIYPEVQYLQIETTTTVTPYANSGLKKKFGPKKKFWSKKNGSVYSQVQYL